MGLPRAATRGAPASTNHNALFRRREYNVSKCDASLLAALKVNRPWRAFVAIESSAGDARDLFMIDNGYAILHQSHGSPKQRDVKSLPDSVLPGLLRRGVKISVDPTRVVGGSATESVSICTS